MALFDQLSAALSPVAASLVAQLGGSTIRVRTLVPVRQRDGSTTKTWVDTAGLTALAAMIANIASDRAVRAWGTDRRIEAEATIVIPAGVALDVIAADMGLVVTAGPRAGQKYIIAAHRVDDVPRVVTLALVSTIDATL